MAETVVMIHGMWGSGWYWENFKGFFESKGYQCVVPTLRYHDMDPNGVPDPRLGTTSLLDYAADLEKLIRELHVMSILMGHSMGGLLAQILGSRGLAKALVLLNSCIASWNHCSEGFSDKELLERPHNMGFLEEAISSDV